MSALHTFALASMFAFGSLAPLSGPDSAAPAGPMNDASNGAMEVPAGPGLLLDLFQTHAVVQMPENLCGYQMQVFGQPGAHFQVEVRPSGQSPILIGAGVIGEDGTYGISLLPIWCEPSAEWVSARVVSFAEAPIAVKLQMF